MKRELEALLFATDSPLPLSRLKRLFPEADAKTIRDAMAELEQEYAAAGHAFTLVEFGGGWQVATRPEFAPLVEKMLKTRKYARLSRAGLEVLAIIAYRQPITRLEIDEIRGVQSSGALATLQERNLATVVGRSETVGHPLLYGTTREFLGHLGLQGLSQLPDLPTVEEVVENREDLKEFANQFGEELTDEELESLARQSEIEEAEAHDEQAAALAAEDDEAAGDEESPADVDDDPDEIPPGGESADHPDEDDVPRD